MLKEGFKNYDKWVLQFNLRTYLWFCLIKHTIICVKFPFFLVKQYETAMTVPFRFRWRFELKFKKIVFWLNLI